MAVAFNALTLNTRRSNQLRQLTSIARSWNAETPVYRISVCIIRKQHLLQLALSPPPFTASIFSTKLFWDKSKPLRRTTSSSFLETAWLGEEKKRPPKPTASLFYFTSRRCNKHGDPRCNRWSRMQETAAVKFAGIHRIIGFTLRASHYATNKLCIRCRGIRFHYAVSNS